MSVEALAMTLRESLEWANRRLVHMGLWQSDFLL